MAGAYLDNGLKGRDFLTISDFTTDEIRLIIDAAHDLKRDLKEGIPHTVLEGKSLGMIFTKPSTRTRVSFEVGMYQLGGYALFLSAQDIQLLRGPTGWHLSSSILNLTPPSHLLQQQRES
jgi:ornithine carbamoyltransferase